MYDRAHDNSVRFRSAACDAVPVKMGAGRNLGRHDLAGGMLIQSIKGVKPMRVVVYKSPKMMSSLLRKIFKIPKMYIPE